MCVLSTQAYDNIQGTQSNWDLLLGFHGVTYINVSDWFGTLFTPSLMEEYIQDSRLDGIGDNWVNIFTGINGGVDDDRCATTDAFAQGQVNRDAINEAGGFVDRKTFPSSDFDSMLFIDGCDPAGDGPLP